VALAFVPSSLLLGVTQHITTDLAAVPLFWVVPLALYLLTFVIAFARRPAIPHRLALKLQIVLLLPVAFTFYWQIKALWLVFALHLAAFFFTALACHGELAKSRPPAARLTEFYLWMSFGGVLGGAFNAFAAPLLFNSVLEYPLMLALAGLLRPTLAEGPRSRVWDLALPAILAAALIPKAQVVHWGLIATLLYAVTVGLLAYSFGARPLRFALGVALILVTGRSDRLGGPSALHQARSFFGVHRVLADREAGVRVLLHGTTIHGAQAIDESRRGEPLAYYHREGPLGQAFEALSARVKRVGAVGLGAGASACHKRDGQQWRFFDIDPVVEQIARDPRWFDYLARCAPGAPVILGDARLTLADEPDGAFQLLLLDAFSSDAIPLHLLTREALALYVRKLAPGGVLMLHISNWHIDLEPVVARLAADSGLAGRVQHFHFADPEKERRAYRFATSWVALARSEADLGRLAQDERWTRLIAPAGQAVWTDDYANLVGALRWTRD
jgi:spermidine synthase